MASYSAQVAYLKTSFWVSAYLDWALTWTSTPIRKTKNKPKEKLSEK